MISSLSIAKMPLAVKIALGIIALLLLANIFSPLRLNTDAIRYFNIMLYLKGMLRADDYAGIDYLPHGYPLLLKYLATANVLSSQTIIIINIAAALASGYLICRLLPAKNWLIVTALLLLSHINIKHLTLPTADELFAGCLLLSVWCWEMALKKKLIYYLPAILTTIAAVYLRTAGIVVPCGIILYLIYTKRYVFYKKRYLLVVLVGMVAAAFTLFLFKLKGFEQRNDYFRQLDLEGLWHGPNHLLARIGIHLQEMGELLVNIPYSKLSGFVPQGIAFLIMPVIVVAGLVALGTIVYITLRAKLYKHLVLWVYLCYMLMILLWPFYDARFLVPVIPLFIYCLYAVYERYHRLWVIKLLALVYVVMGLFALTYSTTISVNQVAFLKLYGFDKEMTLNYTQHFKDKQSGKVVVYDIDKQRILYILNTYDK